MRLFSASFGSLPTLFLNGWASRTVCNRSGLHRVHKRLGIRLGLALGIAFSEVAFGVAVRSDIAHPYPTLFIEEHHPLKNVSSEEYIRSSIACPANISDLVPLLLRDLPSYANRVSTRAQVLERSFNPRGVVIAAAQTAEDAEVSMSIAAHSLFSTTEERTPISLDQTLDTHHLIPLFFTTLERQYVDDQAVRLQHYHWAFLSQTTKQEVPQWHLALMFSRLGDYPTEQPVAPPRESRQGSIGQALQLWLRDCNAGSVAGQGSEQG